jgi:hypothetical protein
VSRGFGVMWVGEIPLLTTGQRLWNQKANRLRILTSIFQLRVKTLGVSFTPPEVNKLVEKMRLIYFSKKNKNIH